MAHLKQSKKRILTNEKARVRNMRQRSAMKSALKQLRQAETKDAAKAVLANAMSRVDKAAKKNVIHKNAAARLKSRMAKRINTMSK